jgi:hypothetical protein
MQMPRKRWLLGCAGALLCWAVAEQIWGCGIVICIFFTLSAYVTRFALAAPGSVAGQIVLWQFPGYYDTAPFDLLILGAVVVAWWTLLALPLVPFCLGWRKLALILWIPLVVAHVVATAML